MSDSKEGTLKPYLKTSNVYWNSFDFTEVKQMHFKDAELDKCTVTKGDLLVCEGGDIGRAAIWNYDYNICIQNHIHRLRASRDVCQLLYLYILMLYKWTDQIQGQGIGLQGLSSGLLDKLEVPLPPFEEQNRIVTAIEQWFKTIDNLDIDNNELKTVIQHTKTKILDLAIHGKLVPQDPNDEPAIELLKRINPKFTPCDKEQYTDKLPDSWCWATLDDICTLITGSTPSKLHSEYYGGDFPFYKPSDLDAGRHVTIPSEYLTVKGKSVSRIIPQGSTLICCIGSIGKCGYIEREGTTNQQINTAVPSQSLNPLYLFYFCNSIFFIDELTADSSAITISIVNKSKLGKMFISLPPIKEQQRIVAKIEEIFTQLDEIKKSLEA